ncbi:hypothetical protein BZA70DRAFT_271688 [Myxozyma melibiosi]|uniref:Uncharacterized protein n=1 Tax=Myxozyma melibiosi TaxID=54550 RepID=A0ABR1FCL0_9ASCO
MADEKSILTFLTESADLPELITRRQFVGLFPASKREDPAVRALYQDLYDTRSAQIHRIQKKINLECLDSARVLREDLARAKGFADAASERDDNDEIYDEILLRRDRKQLSLAEMLSQMELAADLIKRQLEEIDESTAQKLEECDTVVDSLSDLRYKKLRTGAVDECLEGLAVG